MLREERLALYGGLTQNGRPAELVRIKNGQSISLRTGSVLESNYTSAGAKRSAGEDSDDDPLRSMARRRKSAQPAVKEVQQCQECDKIFKRPCDLTYDLTTRMLSDHTNFSIGSMRRLTLGRGSALKRGADTMNTAGQRKKNATAMSMTNTHRTHPCTSVNTARVPTRASAKVIANSTWRRHMAGPMFDPRTTARSRRTRRARPPRPLKSRHQTSMLPVRNSERHLAPSTTAAAIAWHRLRTTRMSLSPIRL